MIKERLDLLGMASNAGQWYLLIILGLVGGSAGIGYLIFRYYHKEKIVKSILERVVKEPITPDYQFFEVQPPENIAPAQTQTQSIDQNSVNPSDGTFEVSYQRYAGQFEGFTLVLLFRLLSFILHAFPSLESIFPRAEDRVTQVIKIKAFTPKEQVSFFKTLLRCVPEKEVWMELDSVMDELREARIEMHWKQTVPKLESLVGLAQTLDDRTFLIEIFLLTVLIRISVRRF
ncbi:MAG: hypothetical protein LUQ65_08245 [Candidatus Helarchaeota archaeon]|nr:hypothetical protein [Candidatus Helarchaeota archaeon]